MSERAILMSCTSGAEFAGLLGAHLNARGESTVAGTVHHDIDWSFPDGEVGARLPADVAGRTVYVVQALADPTTAGSVNDNLLRLMAAGDACREWGARHVVAVVPFLAYTRQDRHGHGRDSVTAQLVPRLLAASGFSSVMSFHVAHRPLGALDQIAIAPDPIATKVLEPLSGRRAAVVIAPDGGAGDFAVRMGAKHALGVAVCAKRRLDAAHVEITKLQGLTAAHRVAVVVDDLIASADTLLQTLRAVRAGSGVKHVIVYASHLVEGRETARRLDEMHAELGLQAVHITNSSPVSTAVRRLPFVTWHDVSPLFAPLITASRSEVDRTSGDTGPIRRRPSRPAG